MTNNEKLLQENLKSISDNDIGLRIKAAREGLGFSQIDMHNKTGLSRTVLINYEAGRHKPSAREIKLICDALQISPNFLIYGTEPPHQHFLHLIITNKPSYRLV
jgi:transcriptional regulator with XRE-family HTH domain